MRAGCRPAIRAERRRATARRLARPRRRADLAAAWIAAWWSARWRLSRCSGGCRRWCGRTSRTAKRRRMCAPPARRSVAADQPAGGCSACAAHGAAATTRAASTGTCPGRRCAAGARTADRRACGAAHFVDRAPAFRRQGGHAPSPRPDAAHRFSPGERVRLLVTTSHDAHVYCYLQDETRRILRFYPNRFSKSAAGEGGRAAGDPGQDAFRDRGEQPATWPETVACFASERDVIAEASGSRGRHRLRKPVRPPRSTR